jgi:hypothetical protein
VLSSETGLTSGTLTLARRRFTTGSPSLPTRPTATSSGAANLTLNFSDGSSYTTTYYAPDWFNNTYNIALGGVDRIDISTGALDNSGTDNPRFYETTINDWQALLGASNKPLASLTFAKRRGPGRRLVRRHRHLRSQRGTAGAEAPAIITQPSNVTVPRNSTPLRSPPWRQATHAPLLQWYENGERHPRRDQFVPDHWPGGLFQ